MKSEIRDTGWNVGHVHAQRARRGQSAKPQRVGVTRGQMVNVLEIVCKHDISKMINVRDVILTMWIVFGRGQRSFGVTSSQKV